MKKTLLATIAISAALVIVLAAAFALVNQPSQASSGTLAIMGTDPAKASSGVSDATMQYSSVSAHVAGSAMSGGWVQVAGSGTMDLMAQGTAQVLGSSQVGAGSYDAFRFNVDSVGVVYQGQTYSAALTSTTMTATSQSKVQVNTGSSASALVDLRSFVVNTATTSSPQFVFSATAAATAVPVQSSGLVSLQVGSTIDLSNQAWFNTFEATTSSNVNIDTASLTSGTMTIGLENSGSANGQVQEIIVTPVTLGVTSSALPSSLNGSAVFTVNGSGSLQETSTIQASSLSTAGASVTSGASSTLSYSGTIATGGNIQSSGIIPGQQYIITCIGADTYASTTVVAS